MSDIKKSASEDVAVDTVVETEESREAMAEGETPQDFKSDREAAPSHTTFGDDEVTPRLNDGR